MDIKIKKRYLKKKKHTFTTWYSPFENEFKLIDSEYIEFQYGNKLFDREVIDLSVFSNKNILLETGEGLKNFNLIKEILQNSNILKTEIIEKLDYNIINYILQKNIIELFYLLENENEINQYHKLMHSKN